jgi:hypothetical protein
MPSYISTPPLNQPILQQLPHELQPAPPGEHHSFSSHTLNMTECFNITPQTPCRCCMHLMHAHKQPLAHWSEDSSAQLPLQQSSQWHEPSQQDTRVSCTHHGITQQNICSGSKLDTITFQPRHYCTGNHILFHAVLQYRHCHSTLKPRSTMAAAARSA